jgi:hypothetical protein
MSYIGDKASYSRNMLAQAMMEQMMGQPGVMSAGRGIAMPPPVAAPPAAAPPMPQPQPQFFEPQGNVPLPQNLPIDPRSGGGFSTAQPPMAGGGDFSQMSMQGRGGVRGMPLPSWFQGGRGAFNRLMQNVDGFNPFMQDFGGDGGFGGVSGVSGGIGGDVAPDLGGGNQPSGGNQQTGTSPPPAEGPQVVGPLDYTFLDQEAQAIANQQAAQQQAEQQQLGMNPQGMQPAASPSQQQQLGLEFQGGRSSPGFVPDPYFGQNPYNAFNQAAHVEQGAFSTAGMSLGDLAAAWGVGLDSAQALADAGFAPGFESSDFGDPEGAASGAASDAADAAAAADAASDAADAAGSDDDSGDDGDE